MQLFLWNILLAFIYAAISDSFTPPTFLFGFILGYVVLFVSTRGTKSRKYFGGLRHLAGFLIYYIGEFFLASFRVTWDVISPRPKMRPGIVAIPLDCKTEGEINLLANLITLTPGGISLEVSDDRKTLYVHEMYLEPGKDHAKQIKQGLERRVLEVMR